MGRYKKSGFHVQAIKYASEQSLLRWASALKGAWQKVESAPFVPLPRHSPSMYREILQCKIVNSLYYLRYVRGKSAESIGYQYGIGDARQMELICRYPWYPTMSD